MSTQINRSIKEPIRAGLSRDDLWHGPDEALILCWEIGRQLRAKDRELAARAVKGELVSLPWKGGTENLDELEPDKKPAARFGGLKYLAMWQGLRGDDLSIDPDVKIRIACTRTKRIVIFHRITLDNCDP